MVTFTPNVLTGTRDECVIDFFKYFNIVTKVNDSSSNVKLTYLQLYHKNLVY